MQRTLVFGEGACERVVHEVDDLLRHFRESSDTGLDYVLYPPVTPPDRLLPEDLAVTLLVNSWAGYRAFQSLRDRGDSVNLSQLPCCSLGEATGKDLAVTASVITQVASWPGFAASLATKVLHKKRPDLIPLLDNQAIFGAYLNSRWPAQRSLQDSVKSRSRIEGALRSIRHDVVRHENQEAWRALNEIESGLSPIELFDAVWWSYFRKVEPAGS